MNCAQLAEKVAPLDAFSTRETIEAAERKYIETNIRPWIERKHCNKKLNEVVESFEVQGSGLNRSLSWVICACEECDGCDGSGRIASNKGTRTDCPDCWGSGYSDSGEQRTLITDYDGETIA